METFPEVIDPERDSAALSGAAHWDVPIKRYPLQNLRRASGCAGILIDQIELLGVKPL